MSHKDQPPGTIDSATGQPFDDKVAGIPDIRPAGPEGMEDPPEEIVKDWDETDQSSDESFPASDPPGKGVG